MNLPEDNPNGNTSATGRPSPGASVGRVTLPTILQSVRASLSALHQRRSEVERRASDRPDPPLLTAALTGQAVRLIAEVKRRSPSAGEVNPGLDPAARAVSYLGGGAAAISVLTNGPFFGGSLADLEAVAAAVEAPILRKDFVLDPLQVIEARAVGAAAVLLIVRALDRTQLESLLRTAHDWRVEALVETHGVDEIAVAVDAGATLIGVNSRDLDTLAVDAPRAWEWLRHVPADCTAVAESGMDRPADVDAAAAAGADAVLIGTALSRANDPEAAARALTSVVRHGR